MRFIWPKLSKWFSVYTGSILLIIYFQKKLERRPSSSYMAALIEAADDNNTEKRSNPEAVKTKEEYDRIYQNTCNMYEMMRNMGFVNFEKPVYNPPKWFWCT